MTGLSPAQPDLPTDTVAPATAGTDDAAQARPRRNRPARSVGRIGLAGLVAVLLALGLLVAGNAPSAEAKSQYLSKKYHHPKYGQTSKAVRNLQLRLADVGFMKKKYATSYFGSITRDAVGDFRKSVGMKRGHGNVSKKTWKKLVKKSGKVKKASSSSGSSGGSKGVIDKRCRTSGRALCINKTTSKVYYLNHGKVIKTMDARFGCYNSPTRNGTWTVFRKVRHDWSHAYGSAMPLSMYFSGGEAVHYSSDFAARGYAGCSHGCVNIRDKKTLRYVYNRIHVGDRAVVYWS